MDEKITFEKDSTQVKNPKHLPRNVFILYSSWAVKLELASCRKIDTVLTAFLPTNSKGYIISKLRGDKINELFNGKHRLWIEILNKSFEDHIEIKKGQLLGLLVVEIENSKFQHVPQKKKTKKEKKGCITKTKKADRRLFEPL